MSCVNGNNERIKRRYFHYLLEAKGRSPATINIARLSLAKYDRFTGGKDYGRFSVTDAKGFKREQLEGEGRRLSSSYGLFISRQLPAVLGRNSRRT